MKNFFCSLRPGNIFLFIIIHLMSCSLSAKYIIAVQPLGKVDTQIITAIQQGITNIYNADVIILPEKSMPASAFYKPRQRYRADKLLNYLATVNEAEYDKILGITIKDISTTKGKYQDWGILGLGSVDGKTCVVSTFRLKKGRVSYKKFLERLIKVVNHELGHTFGLWHCPHKHCLMRDAQGSVYTLDLEKNAFCEECRKKLGDIVK